MSKNQGALVQRNLVYVQAIFPQEDVIALKTKTGEAHIREAINKAVYFYLKQKNDVLEGMLKVDISSMFSWFNGL